MTSAGGMEMTTTSGMEMSSIGGIEMTTTGGMDMTTTGGMDITTNGGMEMSSVSGMESTTLDISSNTIESTDQGSAKLMLNNSTDTNVNMMQNSQGNINPVSSSISIAPRFNIPPSTLAPLLSTVTPNKDYYLFAILPNNTVVRKKPSTYPTKETPYLIVGIYPNNTIIRKFPNGTLVPEEPVIQVRGFDTRANPPDITSNQVTPDRGPASDNTLTTVSTHLSITMVNALCSIIAYVPSYSLVTWSHLSFSDMCSLHFSTKSFHIYYFIIYSFLLLYIYHCSFHFISFLMYKVINE